MEEASALGDLQKVEEIFERLLITRIEEGLSLEQRTMPGSALVLEVSLSQAARHGHTEVVSYLLEQGVKITGYVMNDVKASRSRNVFQVLLDHGWDINSKYSGRTSLHCNLDNEDIVNWHLENHADPNIPSDSGSSALEAAAYRYSANVVKLLVHYGAKVRQTTALHSAATNSAEYGGILYPDRLEVMAFLLDHGADIDKLEPVIDNQGNPRHVDWSTGTALQHAVASNALDRVRFLLQRGANQYVKGAMGFTPLEVAEKQNLPEIADILRNE